MEKRKVLVLSLAFLIFCLFSNLSVSAEDNLSVNQTIDSNLSMSENISVSQTPINLEPIILRNIFPVEIKLGDSSLNLEVLNNGTSELGNLFAIVSGEGYSTYDMVSIDSLQPGEKSYIILSSSFRQTGMINLTIKINNQIFYRIVNVYSESSVNMTDKINSLSLQINKLKLDYTSLESEKDSKSSQNYDVASVNFDDLKTLIRQAQEDILIGDYNGANAKYNLAFDEYGTVKNKLENVKKISFTSKIRNNAVVFSTIAGALIAFFTLYEILKKKNQVLKEKISEIKIKEKLLKK